MGAQTPTYGERPMTVSTMIIPLVHVEWQALTFV
jgi:hypothetical protein